jgi:hypothetical protein
LGPKFVWIIKIWVRTSKRTPPFAITKIKWLMLFKEIICKWYLSVPLWLYNEIISVCAENHASA